MGLSQDARVPGKFCHFQSPGRKFSPRKMSQRSGPLQKWRKRKRKEMMRVTHFPQEATSSGGSIHGRRLFGFWIPNKALRGSPPRQWAMSTETPSWGTTDLPPHHSKPQTPFSTQPNSPLTRYLQIQKTEVYGPPWA